MHVSIVVPTRNRSALLNMALQSVLRQQGVEFEVIVVDDASDDDTQGLLAALNEPRIRVIRHDTCRGVAAARNHGVTESVGDWIAFLDDDDLWAPDKLARQLYAAETIGRDWVYTGAVRIGADLRIVSGRPPLSPDEVMAALPRYDAIPGGGSTVIVRRKTSIQAGPFDTRLQSGEDWEMWIRLARLGPPACVSSPLVARRLHAANATLDISEIVRGTKFIERMHGTSADWGRLHRWMALSSVRSGRRGTALIHFFNAAIRGEARLVASDLTGMLRQWLGGPDRTHELRAGSDPWIGTAAAWLKDLQTEHEEIQRPRNCKPKRPH